MTWGCGEQREASAAGGTELQQAEGMKTLWGMPEKSTLQEQPLTEPCRGPPQGLQELFFT